MPFPVHFVVQDSFIYNYAYDLLAVNTSWLPMLFRPVPNSHTSPSRHILEGDACRMYHY